MAMLKQLLVNLITVAVAVFLLAMAVEQLYKRNSPYEECTRALGEFSAKFGMPDYLDVTRRIDDDKKLEIWRQTLHEYCQEVTHW